MELSLSGNAIKTFARCITCLARVGNELAIQASPSQLAFHTLNSSRSAYQSITFKPDFFDVYTVSGNQVQCSVLLKAICSLLRTPIASIDNLSVKLPDPDASKVQWALECYSGMRKTYWITCNVEPDIQHLSLDRTKFPSNFVVRPRDLNRLLVNFQSSLQEITIIATEQTSLPSDAANEIGGKAVELRSYIDPTKENDSSLHTQLWIDPTEEFLQYTHTGDPVDVTFGVKELKVLNPSLGSAAKSGSGSGIGTEERQVQGETNLNANQQREMQRISTMQISKAASTRENEPADPNIFHPMEKDHAEEARDGPVSQRHPSNWVDADEDDDDGDEDELCVQSTPPYYEEH
ncbi:cell cycle checkpoint control protein rad9a [Quercus suber]|uniref:Cell cycle checkpoint control protein rad9a n=1 Tax=Quercus suber TaxID=58331 RepID=A0AAW0KTK8_QUESU